ncbi:MAG TPA: GAD domain-containing protein, partial [Candidatus Thermoplasmatota archaeon]|nr:GAD domain-containing protein [Candidatus Thermoplasmatota archaeon]
SELAARGAKEGDYLRAPIDVSDLFAGSAAKAMANVGKGDVVMALALPSLAGLLGRKGKEEPPAPRVGRELADYAKVKAGVKGIFHSDELPAYGIGAEQCGHVASRLNVGANDAYAMVVAPRAVAERALDAVRQRAAMILHGVPEETRDLEPDGTSRYLRPLPGGARMYPETDVPPIRLTREALARIRIPELPKDKLARWAREYPDLSEEQARQLVRYHAALFEKAARETGLVKEAARLLLSTLPELEAKGFQAELAGDEVVVDALRALKDGAFAKEALPQVLRHAAEKRVPAKDAAAALGLGAADRSALVAAIDAEIATNAAMVREQRERAAGRLMGPLMGRFRGQVSGAELQALLAERIRRFLDGSG